MTEQTRRNARSQHRAVSYSASIAVLLGCVITAVQLGLARTIYLALAAANILEEWPYFLGFALVIIGLLMHASQRVTGQSHVVITVGAGVVGALTVPLAVLYFGFAGIGAESDTIPAIMAAFIASLTPLATAFVGGVFSWRSLTRPVQFRVRGIAIIAVASVALAAACVVFARLSFPVTTAG